MSVVHSSLRKSGEHTLRYWRGLGCVRNSHGWTSVETTVLEQSSGCVAWVHLSFLVFLFLPRVPVSLLVFFFLSHANFPQIILMLSQVLTDSGKCFTLVAYTPHTLPTHTPHTLPTHTPTRITHRHYSSSWRDHSSYSYRYTHSTSFGNYTFIAMDACPSPGPKRPYNFFGILHEVRR